MDRYGFGVGNWIKTTDIVECAKTAEKKGFESIWVPEDYFYRDSVSANAAIAQATTKIKHALGVINVFTRSAGLIAMTAASLDELSKGRLILGLGTSLRDWISRQGLSFKRPTATMRDYVDCVRQVLTGRTINYDGEIVKAKKLKLDFSPQRVVPIYIAAIGPKMLELAGEIGDGALLTAACSPSYVKFAIERIQRGTRKAGRAFSKVDVGAYIFYSPSDDESTAKDVVRPLIALYLSKWEKSMGELMLGKSGFDESLLKAIRLRVSENDIKGASKMVKDDVVEALAATGTPKNCIKKIDEYREAGLKLPILLPPPGAHPKNSLDLLRL